MTNFKNLNFFNSDLVVEPTVPTAVPKARIQNLVSQNSNIQTNTTTLENLNIPSNISSDIFSTTLLAIIYQIKSMLKKILYYTNLRKFTLLVYENLSNIARYKLSNKLKSIFMDSLIDKNLQFTNCVQIPHKLIRERNIIGIVSRIIQATRNRGPLYSFYLTLFLVFVFCLSSKIFYSIQTLIIKKHIKDETIL